MAKTAPSTMFSPQFFSGLPLRSSPTGAPFGDGFDDPFDDATYKRLLYRNEGESEDLFDDLECPGPSNIHYEECIGDGTYRRMPIRSEEE